MCGENVLEIMEENWQKYIPRILSLTSEDFSDMDPAFSHYKAITIIDKKLRPPGAASKAAGAFTLYPVNEI